MAFGRRVVEACFPEQTRTVINGGEDIVDDIGLQKDFGCIGRRGVGAADLFGKGKELVTGTC
jgi:hypothetical protein